MSTAIVYSFNTTRTSEIAKRINEMLNHDSVQMINIEDVDPKVLLDFSHLILGVPTWFDGELPNYWDEALPALEDLDFTGKEFAVFGLADQVGYPDNFADAVGILAAFMQRQGAMLCGQTNIENYTYRKSKAEIDGQFQGLILDEDQQPGLTNERIKAWIKGLKTQGF